MGLDVAWVGGVVTRPQDVGGYYHVWWMRVVVGGVDMVGGRPDPEGLVGVGGEGDMGETGEEDKKPVVFVRGRFG